ncbi:MAG TPA: carboxypeptidase regulatory-like domain-containing protein [Granulicella sp.]|nr:carboxypeptidase regulatory-like domain-containing protein [Granulicella sp.]
MTLGLGPVVTLPLFSTSLHAQTITSGDIAGVVTDGSGAAVPNAKIVVTSTETGVTQTLTSNSTGAYRASLLKPGVYKMTVTEAGFETFTTTVTVATGQIATVDAKLPIGSDAVTVDVSSEAPLLHTEDAQISTSFSQQEVQNLPNPGDDLTYVAQVSPGAVMNTSSGGGYGNFSVFGLPATSNTFTLNGTYENDPFLNINSSGATNLLLGNNEVSEVDVVSNAYSGQYGGLGGAQVNEVTLSGTNKFHGNAVYQWNGRALNANSYFRNQTPTVTPRSFDNVNQFGARLGGPIIKDRLFFFVDYEGLRIVLPASTQVYAPNQMYIKNVLAAASPQDRATYAQIFSLYQNAKGYSTAVQSAKDPYAVGYTSTQTNFTSEALLTARVDAKLTDKDTAFGHFKYDKGTQATFTDPINPIFNSQSPQPSFEGTFGETHVLNPNMSNQFLFNVMWYSSVFTNQNLAAANALLPYVLNFKGLGGSFTTLGGEDQYWPQGRNVTNYQFIDDFSVTHGHHTIQTGIYFRRDDITDYSPSVYTTPLAYASENTTFYNAQGLDIYTQQYPKRLTQPVSLYNLAGYVQDSWKIRPNLNITAAVRLEHNSNPVCGTNCFAYTNGQFSTLNPSTSTPYSSLISSGNHAAFPSYQAIAINPRVGFSWSPLGTDSRTVVRGGFGMFTDVFPGTVADDFLNNAPTNVGFTLYGPYFGGKPISVNAANPTSGEAVTYASNKAFQAGFQNGASYNSLSSSVNGFAAPSLYTAVGKLHYPTYEEYSIQVEQAIDPKRQTVVSLSYVGNHGYHEPELNSGVNAYGVNNGKAGATGLVNFTGLPNTVPNGSFAQVTEVSNGSMSNYNGLLVGVSRRTKSQTISFNYTYGHALDEISNGGILQYSLTNSLTTAENPYNLRQNYGNADYDVRHNITASYVLTVPYFGGPKLLTDGWQVSGTVFHHTGFPFTVMDSALQATNYSAGFFAAQVHGVKSCGVGGSIYNNATGTVASPCGIATPGNYVDPTAFGQQRRNQIYGPSYTDTDVNILKGFHLAIPHSDTGRLEIGAQFFNALNHPNFAAPGHDIANPTTLGVITSTVNTPTSILGSALGGDASARLIQLKGTITF